MMKLLFSIVTAVLCSTIFAVEPEESKDKTGANDFIITKEIPTTSVKNQYRTNTCWSFASISFVESELLRTHNIEYDLSEMFIVRNVYIQKANKYVRMHGTINFSGGGESNDVLNVISTLGIVPNAINLRFSFYSASLRTLVKQSVIQ